jgi:hypothetical protein
VAARSDIRCAQCAGKIRFKSFRLANEVARRMRQKDKLVAAYPCPHSRGWHVGTSSWKKR